MLQETQTAKVLAKFGHTISENLLPTYLEKVFSNVRQRYPGDTMEHLDVDAAVW